MATARITLAPATFSAQPVGYKFTASGVPAALVTGGVKIKSATLTATNYRSYTDYCWLKITSGDWSAYTNVFGKAESLKSSGTVGMTFNADHSKILATTNQTWTFEICTSRSNWTGNYFDHPRATDWYLDIEYEILFETSTFTLDKTSLDMGTALTMTVASNSVNSGFTHTVKVTMGSQTLTGSRTGPGTIILNIPKTAAWLGTLPNATSGTATVTLTTAGNGSTGTASKTVTLKVPSDILPAAGTLTITRTTTDVVGSYWVQGISQAKAALSGGLAGTGATISSYKITGGGYTANSSTLNTGVLNTTGTNTFTATVTDSRGRTATVSTSITVTTYKKPTISSFSAYRTNSSGATAADDGTYFKVKLTGSYTNIGSNAITVDIYSGLTKIASGKTIAEATSAVYGSSYAADKSYSLKAYIYDSFNTASAGYTATASYTLPSAYRTMDFYPSVAGGVAMGKIATKAKALDLGPDWEYCKNGVSIFQNPTITGQLYLNTWVPLVIPDPAGNLYYIRSMGGTGNAADLYFLKGDNSTYIMRLSQGRTVTIYNLALDNPLPVSSGGTGQTTVAAARNAMGLGNTTGAVPVANGGTGATAAADARTNLGLKSGATTLTQYGRASLSVAGTSTGTLAVTFSTAFSSTPRVAIATVSGSPLARTDAISNQSTTGFTANFYNGFTSATTCSFDWIAVGT